MLIVSNPILRKLIKSSYELTDIQRISEVLREKGTFEFRRLSNGLFPAIIVETNTEYTGYGNVWVRDNVYIAYSHYALGIFDVASKNINTLMTYFRNHRHRFVDIIENRIDASEPMSRPHVRFDGNELKEIDQKWAHAQNDALGYFLWLYCEMASRGVIIPQRPDAEILALFVLYFQAIRYWEDEDSGHWEEVRKISASSIGVVIAGLEALKQLIKISKSFQCEHKKTIITVEFLERLIQFGKSSLEQILPWECVQSDLTKRRQYDAALLFLIYPLRVVQDSVADQILQEVISNLQGDYGIRRYLGDSYWAPDYKAKLLPEKRTADFSDNMLSRNDLLAQAGTEAQWCIFDPVISAIYGLKFWTTKQQVYLDKQTEYLNRSLGQITAPKSLPAYMNVPEFKCPELYYIEKGQYAPNDNVPLLWTQANLRVALKMMEQSLELYCYGPECLAV